MQPAWIVKKFAVVMPWVFLALRRALIPTLCCAFLVFLFYAVPQSREVLHALIPRDSAFGLKREDWVVIDAWPLFWYVATSVTVAFAVWYSARLLCAVQFKMSLPTAWRPSYRLLTNRQIMNAVTWLPRSLGITALAACIGALIFSNFHFILPGIRAHLLVALGLSAPLILASVLLKFRLKGPLHWSRFALWPAVAFYVLSISAFVLTKAEWQVQAVSIWTSLLPADMLLVLVMRRVEMNGADTQGFRRLCIVVLLGLAGLLPGGMLALLAVSPVMIRGEHGKSRVRPADVQLGDVIGRVVLLIVLGVGALLTLAEARSGAARSFGSASAIMLSLAALVILLSAVQLVVRWLTQCVPGLTTALVLLLIVPVSLLANRNIGHEAFKDINDTLSGQKDKLRVSATIAPAVRRDTPRPHGPGPQLYINAFGGGLRAAIFTAQALALADDASCGQFGEHIQATSSVSGGSLGIATYLVARQALVESAHREGLASPWLKCRPGAAPDATPLFRAVSEALIQDHLSAAIARAVSLDLVPGVPPSRGMALLDSWNDALRSAIQMNELNKQETPLALEMPLEALTGAIKYPPTVYFNATDSRRGGIVWFSNETWDQASCEFGSVPNASKQPMSCDGLSVGQAVLHSARFPLITPPGAFMLPGTSSVSRIAAVLVDGGYADDSGGQTLRYQIGHERLNNQDATLLEIDGNPPEDGGSCHDAHADRHATALPVALEALLVSRSARATLDAQLLLDIVPLCKEGDGAAKHCAYRATLDPEQVLRATQPDHAELCAMLKQAEIPPLGWYTGSDAAELISESVIMQVPSICRLAGLKCDVAALSRKEKRRPGADTVTRN